MLINLLPDFLAVLQHGDRVAAYQRYFETHRALLAAYWDNYVVDPDGPHFEEVVRATVAAPRDDLHAMLEQIDVVALAADAARRAADVLEPDVEIDVVVMVGVGAANAGELVVDGRGTAFVCLEHFTGIANPATQGLGLDPGLVPLWVAHEAAHAVRYTSPTSRSALRTLVHEAGGYYSYWETGRRGALREHLVNEGLAVEVSRLVAPGHAAWEYFGYGRRQYARIRELEPMLARAVAPELDTSGLGLRLRWLSGGMSDEARTYDRYVIPERAGYYVGARLVEPAIASRGAGWAIRASAEELCTAGQTHVVATA
ncbi:DUF2268 domain-containing putative Zn-dependent protease [Roseisolibacter agri]|uniref:DUF2268 domain-containing protein n=1 Tax=Roseisolibacter agri TaxID=2014610 RepID=A0AA37VE37_9BACT|nr:hypothetical protein [Roseisolibacter agri]GLC24584.1 hypothetical protein rosag_10970 [Roseisolibacter agri]